MTLSIHGTGRNLVLLLSSSYMIIEGNRRRTCSCSCSFRLFSRMQYDF